MFQPTPSQSALVLMIFIGVPVLLAWLGLLIQCSNASYKSDGDKIAWVLILIMLGPIGAGLYLIAGRSRQIKSDSREKWVV
ncbi:MAG: PLDc N-terminal domain-containing protein [Holophagaceae bacterium]